MLPQRDNSHIPCDIASGCRNPSQCKGIPPRMVVSASPSPFLVASVLPELQAKHKYHWRVFSCFWVGQGRFFCLHLHLPLLLLPRLRQWPKMFPLRTAECQLLTLSFNVCTWWKKRGFPQPRRSNDKGIPLHSMGSDTSSLVSLWGTEILSVSAKKALKGSIASPWRPRLSREVMDAPFLETLKVRLELHL